MPARTVRLRAAAAKESELQDSQFAFVYTDKDGKKQRKERIDDAAHVRNALARFRQVTNVSDGQRDAAWGRLKKAAKRFGVDVTEDSWHGLKGACVLLASSLSLDAAGGAPNRHPFTGVLCQVDEPSTRPPEGSGGKRVILPREVAERIVSTLVGQAVDLTDDLDGHETRHKVGVITEASVEGGEVRVRGHLWDADFPEVLPKLKAHLAALGMSFELDDCRLEASDQPGVVTIADSSGFTGAAILLRRKAAYEHTRLAARAGAEKGPIQMDPEELQRLIASSVATAVSTGLAGIQTKMDALGKKVDAAGKKSGKAALMDDMKELHGMHAKAAEAHEALGEHIANLGKQDGGKVEGAGEELMAKAKKAHEDLGSNIAAASKHLKAMRADAADGGYAHEEPDGDEGERGRGRDGGFDDDGQADKVEAAIAKATKEQEKTLKAQAAEIASLKARVDGTTAQQNQPDRKTLTPEITALLARAGVTAPAEGAKGEDKIRAAYDALEKLKITDPVERTRYLMQLSRSAPAATK